MAAPATTEPKLEQALATNKGLLAKLKAAEERIAELEASPDETISVRLQTAITQLTSQRDDAFVEIANLKETIAEQDKIIVGHSQNKVPDVSRETPELRFIPGSKIVMFAERITPGEMFYMERYLCTEINGWEPGREASTVESSAWRFNGKDSANRPGAYYEQDENGRNVLRYKNQPPFSKNAYIETTFRIVNPDVGE
jgi:hypothetical protein